KFRSFIKVLGIEDVCVYPREIEHQVLAAKELWEAFHDMTSVTKCIYKRAAGPDKTFVEALTTIPLLTSFELVDTIFQRTQNPEFNWITGLTRVAFHFSDYWRNHTPKARWDLAVVQHEAYYLLVLLSGSAPTLEYVEIPGEIACPEEMSEYRPLIPLLRQAPSLCIPIEINAYSTSVHARRTRGEDLHEERVRAAHAEVLEERVQAVDGGRTGKLNFGTGTGTVPSPSPGAPWLLDITNHRVLRYEFMNSSYYGPYTYSDPSYSKPIHANIILTIQFTAFYGLVFVDQVLMNP
ncbi:hypothetical protein JB92DRAFT_3248710, partial [Gautieria morchelliformis]